MRFVCSNHVCTNRAKTTTSSPRLHQYITRVHWWWWSCFCRSIRSSAFYLYVSSGWRIQSSNIPYCTLSELSTEAKAKQRMSCGDDSGLTTQRKHSNTSLSLLSQSGSNGKSLVPVLFDYIVLGISPWTLLSSPGRGTKDSLLNLCRLEPGRFRVGSSSLCWNAARSSLFMCCWWCFTNGHKLLLNIMITDSSHAPPPWTCSGYCMLWLPGWLAGFCLHTVVAEASMQCWAGVDHSVGGRHLVQQWI